MLASIINTRIKSELYSSAVVTFNSLFIRKIQTHVKKVAIPIPSINNKLFGGNEVI